MKIPCEIEVLIKYITALQAYEIIKALGNPRVQVFAKGLIHDISTIVEDEGIKYKLAKEVGFFRFWGGPPNKLAYYDGTLYTLLCDRILDTMQAHGYTAVREVICLPTRERVRVCL